jgi:hypothetical protein
MRERQLIGILVCLLALAAACSAIDVRTVAPIRVVTTTTTVQPVCTAPCECMAAGSAAEKWGADGYTQCSQTPCGRAPTATAVIPYYCFRQKTATGCPSPCECLSKATATAMGRETLCGGREQICGYDRQQNPLYCFEPSATCRDGCTCLSRDEGAAKQLSLCDGKLSACGRTAENLPKYCYAIPAPPTGTMTQTGTRVPVAADTRVPVSIAAVTAVGRVPLTVQTIVTAGPAPVCALSGALKNFSHGPETVDVEVQEAVYLKETCMAQPPYTCTRPQVMVVDGTAPSSAAVTRAGSALTYMAFVSCQKSYRISVQSVESGPCTWKGSWIPAKSTYAVMNGTGQSGYDFSFSPENAVEDAACALCSAPGLPASFDWRNVDGKNWMTPVRDQAGCGSCWAMATLGVTEAMYNIESNAAMNLNLAEQNFISCTGGGGTCAGGWPFDAATYMKENGVVTEACFPYVASNAPCSYACASPSANRWKISEHTPLSLDEHIPRDTNGWKRALLCRGPLAVCDHSYCVTLVGWNDATGKWIFKNSWGEDYGTDGYGTRSYTDDTWMLYAWWWGGVSHKPLMASGAAEVIQYANKTL